jgi:uncharacterized membrane protein YdjX (TVP38/TMEM64 family)
MDVICTFVFTFIYDAVIRLSNIFGNIMNGPGVFGSAVSWLPGNFTGSQSMQWILQLGAWGTIAMAIVGLVVVAVFVVWPDSNISNADAGGY